MVMVQAEMLFIPSPIKVSNDIRYQVLVNRSSRMQYFRKSHNGNRVRIGRGDFIEAFNTSRIIAVKPLQSGDGNSIFQYEFYTRK